MLKRIASNSAMSSKVAIPSSICLSLAVQFIVSSCQSSDRTILTKDSTSCSSTAGVTATNSREVHVPLPHVISVAGRDSAIRGIALDSTELVIGRHGSGAVEAYDTRSGALVWRWRAPDWVHNDPVIVRDLVVVTFGDNRDRPTGADSGRVIGARDGGVVALRRDTGSPVWSHFVGGSVMTSAAVWGDTVAIVTGNRRLMAYEKPTGRLVAEVGLPGFSAMANPQLDRGGIIVGVSDPAAITVIDRSTLRERWTTKLPAMEHGTSDVTPAVLADLIITSGTHELTPNERFARDAIGIRIARRLGLRPRKSLTRQLIAAVDRCDGSVRWVRSLGVGFHVEDNRSGTPVISNGSIFMASPVLEEVLRLDRDGRVLWRRRIPGLAKGYVVVTDGRVAAATESGGIVILDAHNGSVNREYDIGERLGFFSPLAINGELLIPTQSGKIVALNLNPTDSR